MAFKKVSPETQVRAEEFWHPEDGESVSGQLLRYVPPVKKKSYGFYVVKTATKVLGINDCYAIGTIFRQSFSELQSPLKPEMVGKLIELTYHGLLELPSGNTVKQFDVGIDDGIADIVKPTKYGKSSKKATDEETPF